MIKIIAPLLIFLSGITTCSAQRLGYFKDVYGSLTYTNLDRGGTSGKASGASLDFRGNYSLLGSLIFKNSDLPFMIGDHLGAGFGIGYFKLDGADFPVFLTMNLEYGLKGAFAINDEMEVGVKYVHKSGNYFTNLKDDFVCGQTSAIYPTVRFKTFMGSVGFGKGMAGNEGHETGKFFALEGRMLFSDDADDRNTYMFFRGESYSAKSLTETEKSRVVQLYFGIGIM